MVFLCCVVFCHCALKVHGSSEPLFCRTSEQSPGALRVRLEVMQRMSPLQAALPAVGSAAPHPFPQLAVLQENQSHNHAVADEHLGLSQDRHKGVGAQKLFCHLTDPLIDTPSQE